MTEPNPFSTAQCRVCGEMVIYLMAPLHAEDHAQRGEYPGDTGTKNGDGHEC